MISIDLLGSRVALPAGKIFNGDNAHELNHVYPPHFNSHKVVPGPATRDEGDSQPEHKMKFYKGWKKSVPRIFLVSSVLKC